MYNKIVDILTICVFLVMFSSLGDAPQPMTTGFLIGWMFAFILFSVPVLIVRKVLLMFGGLFESTDNGK